MYKKYIRGVFLLLVALPALLPWPVHAASWTTTGALPERRSENTATLLANGKVLVAGGYDQNPGTAVLYDPATQRWVTTGSMTEYRYSHTATLLANGKVLVAGGLGCCYLASAALYHPVTGQWAVTGAMPEPRVNHTATLLANGKVLVAGGNYYNYSTNNWVYPTPALYDPATGQWTATGAMPGQRVNHTATLLTNGKVLVAGGVDASGSRLTSAVLYDPATGQWTATGAMPEPRDLHTATLLANGKVLVAGGGSHTYPYSLANAVLYDPATGQWTATGVMPDRRENHTATLLTNGKVLVTGGRFDDGQHGYYWIYNAALYDPATESWIATAAMTKSRDNHTATLLANGKVLVAGGIDSSAELYTPDTGDANAADFVVTKITLRPASPVLGMAFKALVTVTNQGMSAGDGGNLLVWTQQVANQACSAGADGSVAVGSLAAGESKTLTVSGLVSDKTLGHTLRVYVDGSCVTLESNDSNNQRTATYQTITMPDFVVSAITLNPAIPSPDSDFKATITVTNQGTAAGRSNHLSVWADQPTAQACGAAGDEGGWPGFLAAGASKTITVTFSSAGPAGVKRLRAFADDSCDTPESNETNNQAVKAYRVN